MSYRQGLKSIVPAIAVSLVAACGGGGGGGAAVPTKALSGVASLGAIVGANCTVAAANNPGVQLASGTTNANGEVNWNVPQATGAVIVTCNGGSFYDEALDATVTLNKPVRSIVPSSLSSTAITPLTELAAAAVIQAGGTITDSAINSVADGLASYFGVENILAAPQVVRNSGDLATLSGQAGVYAAVLAGLADQAANFGGADASDLMVALRNDLLADSRLGNDPANSPTQSQIDSATNNRAAGTPAGAQAQSNQSDPNRNSSGTVNTTGGSGGNP